MRFDLPFVTVHDSLGVVAPGALLYFYESGAFSTPLDTYSDSALTVPNSNPVVANSAGRFSNIELQQRPYSVVATEADGTQIWTADPVYGVRLSSDASGNLLVTGPLTMTGAINEAKGSDIASASSVDIGAATGNYLDITGTTPITALGTVQAGVEREIQFDGALTLTHNATSLILPGGANITTAAGDVARFRSEGSGNWRCVNYTRADSAPFVGESSGNPLINGDFIIDQRRGDGTAYTSATTPANSDDTYLLDRWILLSDGNDRADVSQETTVIPSGGRAAIRLDAETLTAAPNSEKFGILQVIENKNCAHLIGQSVSLSFKARTTSGAVENLRAHILAWDGTADIVTSDVVSAWANEGVNPTFVANWTVENTAANLALTNSYQTFKIEGVSIDTANAANVAVFIHVDDTDLVAGDLVYIADVQLELGSPAKSYERLPVQDELERCQRYYQKTFDQDTIPAANGGASQGGALRGLGADAGRFVLSWHFEQTMRTAPAITSYNPGAAASTAAFNTVDSTSTNVNPDNTGDSRVHFLPPTPVAGDANDYMVLQVAADAEL